MMGFNAMPRRYALMFGLQMLCTALLFLLYDGLGTRSSNQVTTNVDSNLISVELFYLLL